MSTESLPLVVDVVVVGEAFVSDVVMAKGEVSVDGGCPIVAFDTVLDRKKVEVV